MNTIPYITPATATHVNKMNVINGVLCTYRRVLPTRYCTRYMNVVSIKHTQHTLIHTVVANADAVNVVKGAIISIAASFTRFLPYTAIFIRKKASNLEL